MGRAKKIDYAALFSFDKKSGLYYTTRAINGVKKKFRAKDPEELQRRVEEALGEKPKVPTFREAAEDWKEKKWSTIRENTQICYNPYYKNAIDVLGDRMITDIVPADIERIILRMKDQGYSAQTIRTQKAVLRMIFNHAIVQDHAFITFNPADAVTIPRGLPKAKRTCPDDNVMQIIIDNVDKATFGLFPFFLLYTGCRRGEALALTWGDIDFKNKLIYVNKQYTYPSGMPVLGAVKTKAGDRTMYLLSGLKRHLRRPQNAKDSDLVFPAPNGQPLQEKAFRRRWVQYCKDTGLVKDEPEERTNKNGKKYIYHNIKPTLTPHQLRHGYATLLVESGVDEKTAQSLMGHEDIHTTMQTYAAIRESHRNSEADKLAKYMKRKYAD